MPTLRFTHIEVYLFRRRPAVQLLLLRRSEGRTLPGVWQPVTGHLKRGESAFEAARREVLEETGLAPRRWWALESPTLVFDAMEDCARVLPVFAAEITATAKVRLSREHDASRYCSTRWAAALVLWDAQRSAIAALESQLFERPRLAAALAIGRRRSARR